MALLMVGAAYLTNTLVNKSSASRNNEMLTFGLQNRRPPRYLATLKRKIRLLNVALQERQQTLLSLDENKTKILNIKEEIRDAFDSMLANASTNGIQPSLINEILGTVDDMLEAGVSSRSLGMPATGEVSEAYIEDLLLLIQNPALL